MEGRDRLGVLFRRIRRAAQGRLHGRHHGIERRRRKSFGCSSESDATYLARALFDEELRRTYSFEKAFESARKSIAERERSQGYEPSEPQMHMGPALRVKLAEIERRLAAREAGAASGVR